MFGKKDGGGGSTSESVENAAAMSMRFMSTIGETLGGKDAKRSAGSGANDVTEFNILCTPGLVSTEFIKDRMKQAMKSELVETLVLDDLIDRNDDEVNRAFVEFMKKDTRGWTAIKIMSSIDVTEFQNYYKKKERLVDALNSQALKKLRLPIKIRVKVHIGPDVSKDRPAYKMIKDLLRDRRLHFIRAYQEEGNEVKKLSSLLAPGKDGERRSVTMFVSFWGPKKNKPDYESWHKDLRLMLSQLKGVDDTTFEEYEEVYERGDNDVVKLNDDVLEELMALDADLSDEDDDFHDEPHNGRMERSSNSHVRATMDNSSNHRRTSMRRRSSFPPREGSRRQLQKATSKARLSSRQLDVNGTNSQNKRASFGHRQSASKRNIREEKPERPGLMKLLSSASMNVSDKSHKRRPVSSNHTRANSTRLLNTQSSRRSMMDTSANSHNNTRPPARPSEAMMESMDSLSERPHRSRREGRSVSLGVSPNGKKSDTRSQESTGKTFVSRAKTTGSTHNHRNHHVPSMDYSYSDRNIQRVKERRLTRRTAPNDVRRSAPSDLRRTAPNHGPRRQQQQQQQQQQPPISKNRVSRSYTTGSNRMPASRTKTSKSRPDFSPIREKRKSRSPVPSTLQQQQQQQVGTYREKGKTFQRSSSNQTPSNIFAALEATNRTPGSTFSDNDRDETSQRILSALLATNT